jgi:hypothetical protein
MNHLLKKLTTTGTLSAVLLYAPFLSAKDENRGGKGGSKGNSGVIRGNGGGSNKGSDRIQGAGRIQGGSMSQGGGKVKGGGVIQGNPIRGGGVIQGGGKPQGGGVIQGGGGIQGGGKTQGGGIIQGNPVRGGGAMQGGIGGSGGVLQGGGGIQAGGLQKKDNGRPDRIPGNLGNKGSKDPIGPITRDKIPTPGTVINPNNGSKNGGLFKDPKLPGNAGAGSSNNNNGRPPRILDDVPRNRTPNAGGNLPGGRPGSDNPGRSNKDGKDGQPNDVTPGKGKGSGNDDRGAGNGGSPNGNAGSGINPRLPLEKRPDRPKNNTKVPTVLKNQPASRFNDNLKNALSEQSPELKRLLGDANRGNAANANRNANNINNLQRLNRAQWNQWQAQNWNRNLNRYHQSWYRGTWGGFNSWYLPFGLLYGLGGLGPDIGYGGYGFGNGYGFANPWLYNSLAYRYGYRSYYNPYCLHVHDYPYNYMQPIYLVSYSTTPTYTTNSYSFTTESETTVQNLFAKPRLHQRAKHVR